MNDAPTPQKRLNVLYLIRTWALGGSHTIIRLLVKHLPKEEFNVIVVPFDTKSKANEDFIKSVRKQGDEVAPERIPWRSRTDWFKARDTIARLIDKYKIDVVHCHDTNSIVLVGLGRKRFPCAAVASPYGWWEPRWHLQARLYHWVEKNIALPNFERVYTVSETMRKNVLKGRTQNERIRVIHTGLDLAQFDKGGERLQIRAHYAISDKNIVIGTVSRLFREKGHRYLIDAAKQLAREFPNIRLLIVGTGDERDALERQAMDLGIRDKVIFTGFYDDLPGILRAMDIFAQPSILDEGFPTAVLEAQAAGLPIVASDIGGTFETIQAGATGILVPPRDSGALARALREVIVDGERRAAMAAAARPWIEQSFTLENMIAQMGATYREAHSLHRGP